MCGSAYNANMRRPFFCLIASLVLTGLVTATSVTGTQSSLAIRVVSYNIKHGRGNDDTVDLKRTAGVLRGLTPDIVGLQEVDRAAERSGKVDEARALGEMLGLNPAFGRFMDFQGGAYGMGVLSRFPVTEIREVRLPDGNEPRVALAMDFTSRAAEATKPRDNRLTFSSTDPVKEIDFIFMAPRAAWTAGEVRVIDEKMASDHRPLLSVLTLR